MFHPQTTQIQPLVLSVKFRKYDVIIYDVSVDFEILFDMWNSLVMSYACAKFHHDITINNGINCIFHGYFWTNDRGQYNDVIIHDVIKLYAFFA